MDLLACWRGIRRKVLQDALQVLEPNDPLITRIYSLHKSLEETLERSALGPHELVLEFHRVPAVLKGHGAPAGLGGDAAASAREYPGNSKIV